jgi:hypothetical protein
MMAAATTSSEKCLSQAPERQLPGHHDHRNRLLFLPASCARIGAPSETGKTLQAVEEGSSGTPVPAGLEGCGLTVAAGIARCEIPAVEAPDRLAAAELVIVVHGDQVVPALPELVEC